MDVTLGELRQAVINYLDNNVTISISEPVRTDGTEFKFTVTVTNASAAEGGVGLTNVRYLIQVRGPGSPLNAGIQVPSGGSSTGPHGESLDRNSWVEFFNFDPSDADLSYLQIGESQSISFTGSASFGNPNFALIARIQADPDLNSVFPRNYISAEGTVDSPGGSF